MFSTLRQTFGDGDRLLSVEIAPPFDKDRMSMRTACERCRIQKSKCVSGENGCMLCVAKNRKCEYLVVSRPRRRTSSAPSGGSKARNDGGGDYDGDDDDNINSNNNDSNKIAMNEHEQSHQARLYKRRSRMQTTRQSSPLSLQSSSSPPEQQMGVATVSEPSIQGSSHIHNHSGSSSSISTVPNMSLEDAQQMIFSGSLFPDALEQIPAAFSQFEPPATVSFFGNVAGPATIGATELRAGRDRNGVAAEVSNTQGDNSKQKNHTSVYSSSSTDSLFEFGVDQMDFLMDESRIPTTAAAPNSAHHGNKATLDGRSKATHIATPPDSDSTSTSTSSSCCCMMKAVSIYEALQAQLVWGDPMAGPSAASTPNSTSAGSSYSSGLSWPGSESGSGSDATRYDSTAPLMTQQTILKRQKTILLRCDSLVRCGTCWSRSDFVMLIITMCDRILTSLEAVERLVSDRSNDDMKRVSSHNVTTSVGIHTLATTPHVGSDISSLSRSSSSQVLQSGVGSWQIDDDDELELIIGLIKSRLTRLGNLIAMAEGTISANEWPWHDRLVQALRKRSNKLVMSLSFRGFP